MTSQVVPVNYLKPAFPSLYAVLPPADPHEAQYLYYTKDAVRFTVLWTLILYWGTHVVAALCAVIMQWPNWKLLYALPLLYCVVSGLEALLAGSVVGAVLGVLYEAGSFRMPTWVPFIWGCMNTLVLILSSFSIQGGL